MKNLIQAIKDYFAHHGATGTDHAAKILEAADEALKATAAVGPDLPELFDDLRKDVADVMAIAKDFEAKTVNFGDALALVRDLSETVSDLRKALADVRAELDKIKSDKKAAA